MPGSLTSKMRQLGPSLRGVDKYSCAVPKDLECKPTDSSSSWRDSRTSLSSSTMNMVGISCVLIPTRLNEKESQNQNVVRFILSSPIKRRLATRDRLYRMMQCGCRARPRRRGGLDDGWRSLTVSRFAWLPAMRHLRSCRREPRRLTWGIHRFTLDFRKFLRELEIRGNAAGDQP